MIFTTIRSTIALHCTVVELSAAVEVQFLHLHPSGRVNLLQQDDHVHRDLILRVHLDEPSRTRVGIHHRDSILLDLHFTGI